MIKIPIMIIIIEKIINIKQESDKILMMTQLQLEILLFLKELKVPNLKLLFQRNQEYYQKSINRT